MAYARRAPPWTIAGRTAPTELVGWTIVVGAAEREPRGGRLGAGGVRRAVRGSGVGSRAVHTRPATADDEEECEDEFASARPHR